jgi:sn-glycerol 3-phosphate transport system permease protein
VIEAAAIDGASFWRRFWTIVFPLLSPTTFFLLVVNLIYAFFDTFGVITPSPRAVHSNPPRSWSTRSMPTASSARTYGSSAAQSVVLLVLVTILTVVQFRFIERRVHY